MAKLVLYIRVSTDRQAGNGLGLECAAATGDLADGGAAGVACPPPRLALRFFILLGGVMGALEVSRFDTGKGSPAGAGPTM
jgi:hypothetical protein